MSRTFNVDDRAGKRETDEVTIGGTVWKPIRRTNKVMAQVQAIATRSEELSKRAKAAEDAEESIPRDVTAEFNVLLYKQIALLIRDPDGKPPAEAKTNAETGEVEEEGFLEQHLDIRDATPVLRFLMGNDPDQPLEGEDDDEEAADDRPTSPPTTSPTPTSPASASASESGDGTPEQVPAPASDEAADAGNAAEWQTEGGTASTSG